MDVRTIGIQGHINGLTVDKANQLLALCSVLRDNQKILSVLPVIVLVIVHTCDQRPICAFQRAALLRDVYAHFRSEMDLTM